MLPIDELPQPSLRPVGRWMLLSLVLHVAAPLWGWGVQQLWMLWQLQEVEMEEDPGDFEDTAAEFEVELLPPPLPFTIAILDEATAPAAEKTEEKEEKPPAVPAEKAPEVVVEKEEPPPPPPPLEPPPEPPPPPEPLTEEQLIAEALAEEAAAPIVEPPPEDDDNGEAFERTEAVAKRPPPSRRPARPPRVPTKKVEPCPPTEEEIRNIGPMAWSLDRELIDYYANHVPKLMELARVWLHRDKEGKPDGFRVALPRCSILRQGGLRSGDVVMRINDRRIFTVLQAVGAYMALRTQPDIQVLVLRQGKEQVLNFHIEAREKKNKRKRNRD